MQREKTNAKKTRDLSPVQDQRVTSVSPTKQVREPQLEMPNIKELQLLKAKFHVGEEYELVKLIGSGSYGEVVLAVHIPTSKRVAIKKIDQLFSSVTDAKRQLREILLLKQLAGHRNIVKLLDILEPPNLSTFETLYLVFEAAPSDIRKLYRGNLFLSERHIKTIMYNLLCGLKFIHSANVVHRDIKPANLLVFQDCTVKIADFGLGRPLKGIITSNDIIHKYLSVNPLSFGFQETTL